MASMYKKSAGTTGITVLLMLLSFVCNRIEAQLKGDHLLGDFGLNAGTQPPPTLIAALPFYWYSASKLKNNDGDVIARPDLNAFLTGIGGSVVTNLKILKGNYGASLLIGFASNRLEGNVVNSNSSLKFTDMYVQPLQLGWHAKHADFTFGYGVYMPTGKYEYGGDDNAGMGMWTHELSAGTTVFFDPKKTFSFSAIGFFETHSEKKGSEARTGNIVSIEGGLGKTFYKKIEGFPVPVIFNAGAIYYMQYKVSDDKIPVGNTEFSGAKDKLYAWGLEANVLHPKIRTSLGIRWLDELGARNRFEGNTFFVTLGYIIKSLEKKGGRNEN